MQPINQLEQSINSLQDRVNHFEAIFDNIPEGVIVIEPNGRVLFSNAAAKSILDNEPHSIPPHSWPEVFGFFLDDRKTHFPVKNLPPIRVFNGEATPSEEMILQSSQDHKPIWISMSAYPLKNKKEQIVGAIVMLRDISYPKNLEASRTQHARRAEVLYSISRSIAEIGEDLSRILNSVAVQTADFIGDACIISLLNEQKDQLRIAAIHHPNPNARSILREQMLAAQNGLGQGIIAGVIESGEPLLIPSISADQLKAISLLDYSSYVEEMGIQSLLIAPIKGQEGVLGLLSLSRDEGSQSFTSDDQSTLLEIAHRTALAIEHSALINSLRQEISDRVSAQKALTESEIRFRTIFQTTFLGVKILDLSGKLLEVNRAFQEIIGYSQDQITGKHFSEFLHPRDRAKSRLILEKLAAGEARGLRLEHRLIHADGSTVWVNASFTAVRQDSDSDSPDFIFGIVENITDRKELELEMREMKSRLQENIERERLRLAQDLHDGPMQVLYSVIFQIEALRSIEPMPPQETLNDLRGDIQKVINELRSTSQELRPPTLADFGLEKAIRSHAEELSEKHPDIQISLYLAKDKQLLPEKVRLALFRIYQTCMANILRHAKASQVHIRFTYDIEEARLEIQDNGVGFQVPNSWIELTRNEHFGLAGAVERAESLGGSFTVKSQPGLGTDVLAIIPCQEHG